MNVVTVSIPKGAQSKKPAVLGLASHSVQVERVTIPNDLDPVGSACARLYLGMATGWEFPAYAAMDPQARTAAPSIPVSAYPPQEALPWLPAALCGDRLMATGPHPHVLARRRSVCEAGRRQEVARSGAGKRARRSVSAARYLDQVGKVPNPVVYPS